MNEFLGPLVGAIGIFADPTIFVFIVLGTILGVFVGALPGLGSTLAFGLVLPFTFAMGAIPSITFLLSISVGIGFGNSLPAIVVGVPGTPATVLTVIEGNALHRRGESGLALAIAFLGAIFGQSVSTLFFVIAVVPLAALAFLFLQPEIFSLYLFGIVAITTLTGKNVVKGFMAAAFGLLVSMIGLDPVNFVPRFTFGNENLRGGLSIAAVLLGLLAVSELLHQARQSFQWSAVSTKFDATFPPLRRIRPALKSFMLGTVMGTLIGPIPGAGGAPSTLLSYQQAQLLSKHPEEFGHGSIEGLAATEAAQNADKSGELIPTLGLGIPGSSSMVLLLAALSINGMAPGPNLLRTTPELLSAAVAGMMGATVVMALVGWWLSKIVLKSLTINRSIIVVFALGIVVLGIFSLSYRIFDVAVCLVFGVIGYFMLRFGYSTGAAALAAVLGAGLEANFRRGLNLFDNDPVVFFTRPITAIVVGLAIVFFIIGLRRTLRASREQLAAAATAEPERRTG